ncbi:hypothetical protein XAUB_12550 [Xanthomonas citri pv. aurantifolii str. ICPB 11122]|nr:hypothetical protein XAUB_12550 [Xanthomonas citri pv. aurantifolii str. ICPB 11122]EFF49553.1 hypothetical protein XAUC_00490 [Xanthomonas citri pv. aurantifolii str. ICPB 10535]
MPVAFALTLFVALVLVVAFAVVVPATAGVAASTECGVCPISSAPINVANRRLRQEVVGAKERVAGVMSVYPGTAKKRISTGGIDAVGSCSAPLCVWTQPMSPVHRHRRQSE